jgi:hypothetical protein
MSDGMQACGECRGCEEFGRCVCPVPGPALIERAAVVAWLRGEAARRVQPWRLAEMEALEYAADSIERGEHTEGRRR